MIVAEFITSCRTEHVMLGHAMSEHRDAALAVASLQRAANGGGGVDGVIFHADRGSEYTAAHTAADCRALGVVQSMGRVGCAALCNATAEAFNSTLKVEFVHQHRFTTRAEAGIMVATWIVDFYSTYRRHSANDGLAPITFECQMAEARRASTAQFRAEVA
ncbi:Integrase core domain-containing protein [Actinomadura madurae]|uniref:Integrase core domain-containing protein n=1 Tax=Actinomadura madurae TaxID=1993 RepID=A0A1I5VBJ5_9ACTN|nr:integrase core domain-containing protein [Actinomadura madurae]SFQ04889.1 Integrase core domain-containing protein [Actinomadura madurae]